jgi:hypothetical protein
VDKKTSDRLKELIVYLAQKCSSDEAFGITKLNKILFYADSYHFLETGKTISGANYIHMERGPVIDGFYILMKDMEKKDIATARLQSGPFMQSRPVALREYDLSSFEPSMISTLDEIVRIVCNKPTRARWLSEGSHELMGWIVTNNEEKIPFETFYLKPQKEQKFNEWEQKHAQEIHAQLSGV